LSTSSRPHLAPYNDSTGSRAVHNASGSGSRSAVTAPAALSSPSRRTTAGSKPGGGIGRHRQQQQQQQQQLGLEPLSPAQQRPSVAVSSPTARVPGFVQAAAAALSPAGSTGRSAGSVAGSPVAAAGSRRPPSRRDSQQQQQQQQQMLTSNPLYDGLDG
jgi:hypothetical protein